MAKLEFQSISDTSSKLSTPIDCYLVITKPKLMTGSVYFHTPIKVVVTHTPICNCLPSICETREQLPRTTSWARRRAISSCTGLKHQHATLVPESGRGQHFQNQAEPAEFAERNT